MPVSEPLKPCAVWAVVYGNYSPSETHSLWWTRAEAETEVERLNDKPQSSGMWEVEEMMIWGARAPSPVAAEVAKEMREYVAPSQKLYREAIAIWADRLERGE